MKDFSVSAVVGKTINGHVGRFHCGLVHKPISVQEALKKPDAKPAVGEEWNI